MSTESAAGRAPAPPVPEHRHERIARAGLLRAAEAPAPAVRRLVQAMGPVGAWDRIRRRQVDSAVRRSTTARVADLTPERLQHRALADLRAATAAGARLVIPEDDEWPAASLAALNQTGDADKPEPLGLYLRGAPLPVDEQGSVTIVGSRSCTPYGRRVAGEFAAELAEAGFRVVSGAAFGIDVAAHRAAMVAASPASTVAVLACGIDRAYPLSHQNLLDEIATGGGTVLSEYPPGTTPARHRFLIRNRLIAALGAVIVVVEAGRRSGTLSTANEASQLGRRVMAVPGPVTSAMSLGCHELLRNKDNRLAATAADVLLELGCAHLGAEQPPPPVRPTDGLDPTAAALYDALPARGRRTTWQLCQDAGIDPDAALGALAELELVGLARREGGEWHRQA
ncbi:DNA-processing protein DprA [Nakamurella aerolata]